jgi:phosphoribosylaminoimidazolecarboxamide formyltransferase/IMP cyclohydrolase
VNVPIRRALLSVSDKTDLVPLARALHELGCELISTGGTRRALEDAGIPVIEISQVTGNPEAFGGRMKTISFAIESALLFDRERDRDEAARLGIVAIDLVVCNLYPFARYRDAEADLPTLLENIDIGGPTMIRAAAKNHRFVAVATSPSQYADLERELRETSGCLREPTRARLARAAFDLTADYDAMVATTLAERAGERSLRMHFTGGVPLRYGENPHQHAAFYRDAEAPRSLHDLKLHGGKELSYNNLTDLSAALEVAFSLERQGCAVIKHANPCGLCEAEDQRHAFELAWAGDPISAFGSVVAFNRKVELATAQAFLLDTADKAKRRFVEVVAAPGFDPAAVDYLRLAKNLRVVEVDPALLARTTEYRFLPGALVAQSVDADADLLEKVEVVTRRPLTTTSRALLLFGQKAVRQLKSNAIAVVTETRDHAFQLVGAGAGQPNRVSSTELAVARARATLAASHEGPAPERDAWVASQMETAILVSDAFFPFPDSIEVAARAGIRTVYQPGGSLRDAEVVARCDELDVAMAVLGRRHFKH